MGLWYMCFFLVTLGFIPRTITKSVSTVVNIATNLLMFAVNTNTVYQLYS